jgi:hypothetical protein
MIAARAARTSADAIRRVPDTGAVAPGRLEPHHVMRLAISDDDYFQTDYGAGLACGIKQPT